MRGLKIFVPSLRVNVKFEPPRTCRNWKILPVLTDI